MMQIIDITSLSGSAPYDIYVCDTTITYCFLVATAVTTVPQSLELPSFLYGAKEIIVKIIDSNQCEFFTPISCLLPTPSITVTPSPTRLIYGCQCITFDNTGSGFDIGYSYLDCNGILTVGVVTSGLTYQVCGSQPVSNDIKMSYTISGQCVNNSCPSSQCVAPDELSLIKSVNRIYKACSSTYYSADYSCTTPSVQVNIASIDFNGQAGCVQYNPWVTSTAPSGRDFNFKAPGANITSWTQLQIGMRLYPATQSPNSACSNLADLNYWVSRNSLQNRYTPAEGPPIIIRVNNSTITNITDCS